MLGRAPSNTRIGAKRIRTVRCRGGNLKYRALRLDAGSFSWGTQVRSAKARILNVVYNASNNELVRTNTLVKSAVVQIDATPFRQWYQKHTGQLLGASEEDQKAADTEAKFSDKDKARHVKAKKAAGFSEVDAALVEQFAAGRLLAIISSRPGQSGRADGYLLEGEELAYYAHKLKVSKKH